MHRGRFTLIAAVAIAIFAGDAFVTTNSADAGPLMDWLLRRRQRRAAYYAPNYLYPNTQQAYYPNTNAGCGTCQTTCQQTCQRVVAQYVPYTAYRTVYQQVPVTTYRRTSSTDPCTGCTTTCNRPCVSYQTVTRRVPYTAYRTVYRTETYRVPVTYNTPAPAAAPACSTCSAAPFPNTFASSTPTNGGLLGDGSQLGRVAQPQNYGSTFSNPTPAGAANSAPSLNQGDVNGAAIQGGLDNEVNRIEPESDPNAGVDLNGASGAKASMKRQPANQWHSHPQTIGTNERTAEAPLRRNFEYKDVYLASYQTTQFRRQPTRTERTIPARDRSKPAGKNSGWQSSAW